MEHHEQRQIANAVLVAGALIAGAILLRGKMPDQPVPTPNPGDATAPTALARPINSNDHIVGSTNAKIIIVEYSDLECPFCKVFHATMHRIVSENDGKVAWVYRQYPIPQLHPKAPNESEASECAWDQGGNEGFWKFADRVFEVTNSNNSLDPAELPKIAAYAGLNVAEFNSCLSSGKFKAKVQADVDDGVKMGVSGTPSSFIIVKGKVVGSIPGAQPYEKVAQQIQDLLK